MLVKNWMSKDVITADVTDSMQDAMGLLKQHNIKMLPVMKKGNLVGIVTDRDLKRASASDATTLEIHELLYLLSKIKVEEIMTKNPITVFDDFTIEEAAEILLKNKISGLPVIDSEKQLVGVITQTDIFRVLISLTGVGKKGVQFAFLLEDQSGSIKTAADIIRKHGGRMVSILTSYERAPQGYRNVYIRMTDIDRTALEKLKAELNQSAKLLYMVDHHQNKREIY
ncbi:MAG: CBS domain-containing protein [Deltaproteobacteria bacterium]|nr:MAG: CBS domain-containing protein [Deltaproteobacteria bacterium]